MNVLKRLTEDRKNEVWVLGELPFRQVLEKGGGVGPQGWGCVSLSLPFSPLYLCIDL